MFFGEKLDGEPLPRPQNPVKVSRFHRLPRQRREAAFTGFSGVAAVVCFGGYGSCGGGFMVHPVLQQCHRSIDLKLIFKQTAPKNPLILLLKAHSRDEESMQSLSFFSQQTMLPPGFFSQQTLMFIFSAILLLLSLLGGGLEIKEVRLPSLGTLPRIISGLGGLIFLVLSLNPKLIGLSVSPDNNSSHNSETDEHPLLTIEDHLSKTQSWETVVIKIGSEEKVLRVSENQESAAATFTLPDKGQIPYKLMGNLKTKEGAFLNGEGAGTLSASQTTTCQVDMGDIGGSNAIRYSIEECKQQ